MSTLGQSIKVHFILESGGLFARLRLHHAPRVGDELRFSNERYYRVTRLVWAYDEDDEPGQRLNVGMEEVK